MALSTQQGEGVDAGGDGDVGVTQPLAHHHSTLPLHWSATEAWKYHRLLTVVPSGWSGAPRSWPIVLFAGGTSCRCRSRLTARQLQVHRQNYPAEAIEYVKDILVRRMSQNVVRTGKLAVTVDYSDGREIQLLPAIRTLWGSHRRARKHKVERRDTT